MEVFNFSTENIFSYLHQIQANKDDLQVIRLLECVIENEYKNRIQRYKIHEEILQTLPIESVNIRDTFNVGLIINCIILVTNLQEQQKLPCLNETQFTNLSQWLLKEQKCNEGNIDVGCKILTALSKLFALHSEYSNKYFGLTLEMILKNITVNTNDVLLITTLQCLNTIVTTFQDDKISDVMHIACAEVGVNLLKLHYDNEDPTVYSTKTATIILLSLQILHKILTLNSNFARLQTGELLGLSKIYLNLGVDAQDVILKPQKILISQQALHDSGKEIESIINLEKSNNFGRKTPKTRKPRAVTNMRWNNCKVGNHSWENRCSTLFFDMKEIDSEVPEPDSSINRNIIEPSTKAKIRLVSINLVGIIARTIDRKMLFGYWHAFLPSGPAVSTNNLLYIGQYDPNLRCRIAALQVCAHLLYGSKGYLHQAEINVKRCPTTFVPFSVSLGYTVLAIYKTVTSILSTETSISVLNQALKCLAVLVQVSPFKQFEKGFVQSFVKVVKPLVYHRDAAIQVSALMVMEFLLDLPQTTCGIAEAVGIPQHTVRNHKIKSQHLCHEEIDIVDIEEFVEFEDEVCIDLNADKPGNRKLFNAPDAMETFWLIRRVLDNIRKQDKMFPNSVRIESLQVLIVISSRLEIIKPLFKEISEALLCSLNDILPDVRLYAARCIDACAYQINRQLLDNASHSEAEIKDCNKFWINMMPFIINQIRRDSGEMTMVRIKLCDALSNIGVLIFEHTSHFSQISLISFLSGVSTDSSEETIVRAASARALAVFALYPSLRSDLVFIENTAELTLRLVKDSNLLVRVKSFWSLGNISDALIGKGSEKAQLKREQISDDLLFRLITAAIAACTDNDKVRCNAVRTLGNLLRLIKDEHLYNDNSKLNWRQIFTKSICTLIHCIRSSGNAKVKWNTCYAISNLMRNPAIFKASDLSWQGKLFPVLCHVIIHHSNFKVRINASQAITNISERIYFGVYFETFWISVLEAVEQSYNLDNFLEYNHQDNLQEQLCLAISHLTRLASNNDLPMLKKHLFPRAEIIRNTWTRVINRIVPEKAAPLLSCPAVLLERGKQQEAFSLEQKNILNFLIEIFSTD